MDEIYRPSIGEAVNLACLLEATAPKPGNVHRGADFEDLTFLDFAVSGALLGPLLNGAPHQRLGSLVLKAVERTKAAVQTNSNLGLILLLAPLAMAAESRSLRTSVQQVLESLDAADAANVYKAIRLANPGGLGDAPEADVHGPPPESLIEAMRLGAERDRVARQYATGFANVFDVVVPALAEAQSQKWPLADGIVYAQLVALAAWPDSLIARKCGPGLGQQATDHAAQVLAAGPPGSEEFRQAVIDFDFWLRSDGHRRNPGTTADLIAAGLFVALREGIIELPIRFYP